ncbi:MAG TPA: lipocalin-like domain-containing protein [Caulobacteraceae bacterium]|jgi:predicted secreted hydrolase
MTDVVIKLPADGYQHVGAPREWWWHIGTLKAGERSFGFEINAAGFSATEGSLPASCFSQVMLSDPKNHKHYKKTATYAYDPTWAQSDTTQPWYVRMGDHASSDWVAMEAVGDISAMHVQASFADDTDGTVVTFDLQMKQQGPPLYVWGTGVAENVDKDGTTPLTRNNYYYSYTNLQVTGTVTIGGEAIAVTGVTWMDHEYGAFGAGTKWVLQDAQLSNGVSITNSGVGQFILIPGVPIITFATILQDGVSTLVFPSLTVPSEPFSKDGLTFYLHWDVWIPFHGTLHFEALMDDQVFPGDRPIYEGAGTVTGKFGGTDVTGTAWIEEAIAPPVSPTAAPQGRGQRAMPPS